MIPPLHRPGLTGLRFRAQIFALSTAFLLGWFSAPAAERPQVSAPPTELGVPAFYFAETTEAFFSRNDFFPLTRHKLKRPDPEMEQLLDKLWGVTK